MFCFGSAQSADDRCNRVNYKFSGDIDLTRFDGVFEQARQMFVQKKYADAAAVLDTYSGSGSILAKLLSNGIKRGYYKDGENVAEFIHMLDGTEEYKGDALMSVIEALFLANGLLHFEPRYKNNTSKIQGPEATKYFVDQWMSDQEPDHVLYAARIHYVWMTKSFRPDWAPHFLNGYVKLRILSENYGVKMADRYAADMRKRLDEIHAEMTPQESGEQENQIQTLYQNYKACLQKAPGPSLPDQ
jgi:hypothetical protein